MQGNDTQNATTKRIATHRAGPVFSLQEAEARGVSFVTAPECASIMSVDARTVRRAIAEGSIPATKVRGHYRIPVSWIRQQAAGEGAA